MHATKKNVIGHKLWRRHETFTVPNPALADGKRENINKTGSHL
jgi:hypothetical protein